MTNVEVYGALALILMELEKINKRLDEVYNVEGTVLEVQESK